MPVKAVLAGVALWIYIFSASQTYAAKQAPCGETSGDESNISAVILQNKPAGWWTRPCWDEQCHAIHDLGCAADAFAHTFHPNFQGYLGDRDGELAFDRAQRTVLALGLNHPHRIPLYCKLLARVAPKINGEADLYSYDWNAKYLTTFAILLDRPANHCLANVIAAAPDTPAAQSYLQRWAIPCLKTIKQCQADVASSLR